MRSDDKDGFRIRAIAILLAVLFHIVCFGVLGFFIREDARRSVLILELDWTESRRVGIESITTEKSNVTTQTDRKRNVSSFKQSVTSGSVIQDVPLRDTPGVIYADADREEHHVVTIPDADELISRVETNPAFVRSWFDHQLLNGQVPRDSLVTLRKSLEEHIQISLAGISSLELESRRNQQWYGQKDNPFRLFALHYQVNLIPILRIVLKEFD